jgi:hypothetical protein
VAKSREKEKVEHCKGTKANVMVAMGARSQKNLATTGAAETDSASMLMLAVSPMMVPKGAKGRKIL